MILKIENIPKNTTRPELRNLFSDFGRVSTIIKRGNKAFIHMPANRRANVAASQLDGVRWNGNYISVSKVDNNVSATICRTPLGIMRMF